MTQSAFPAAAVAAAAIARHAQLQAQMHEPDDVHVVNHEARYRLQELAGFATAAAAEGSGMMMLGSRTGA